MQFFGDRMQSVLPYVDVLFGNEHEAEALAALLKLEGDHKDLAYVAAAASALPKVDSKRPRLVVFTAGSLATVYALNGKTGSVPVAPIEASKIIDTNGAGDAFVGGFLAGYAQRKSVEECILVGHYCAGTVIQHDGCTFPAKPSYAL